jgi:integrase
LVIVRRVFNVARKWKIYDGPNPISAVDLPRVDNERTEVLTPEETARLWAVLDRWPSPDTANLIRFAYLTGLRRGEIFRLKWEDVDEERRTVTLRQPKGGTTVTIPISQPALDVLVLHRDVSPSKSPFVFPGRGGKQRTTITKAWERVRVAAGIPNFRFHGLRHNFASVMISSGVPLDVLREMLGHKHYRTTQRYAHFLPGPLRKAADLSADLLMPWADGDAAKPPQDDPDGGGADLPKPDQSDKVIPLPRRKNGTDNDG